MGCEIQFLDWTRLGCRNSFAPGRIPNPNTILCRNPKPMPESQIYTKIPNICNNIIFLLDSNYKIQITKKNFFKIFRSIIKFVILYYILLTILEFNIYPKQFGISA